mmetsp:Transcript_47548/g.148869  ORF Transcript_47548/g.148869 Transcript_47548/m.148869 type:complete len:121 (+) Transcript_47548:4935-5297(+)
MEIACLQRCAPRRDLLGCKRSDMGDLYQRLPCFLRNNQTNETLCPHCNHIDLRSRKERAEGLMVQSRIFLPQASRELEMPLGKDMVRHEGTEKASLQSSNPSNNLQSHAQSFHLLRKPAR